MDNTLFHAPSYTADQRSFAKSSAARQYCSFVWSFILVHQNPRGQAAIFKEWSVEHMLAFLQEVGEREDFPPHGREE